MTCIIGLLNKQNNTVVVGGDSAGSYESHVLLRKDVKVFRNGEFIIGGAGSFRMIQLLRYKFKPPKVPSGDMYKYMCTSFIDAVKKCFSENGFMKKTTGGTDKGGVFIVAYRDKLYQIESDFQVAELTMDYTAIGIGEKFALGALYALYPNDKLTKIELVTAALECAANFSGAVSGPFEILETVSRKN